MPDGTDTAIVNPYDSIASLYDLEHEDFDDDISLMRNIASIVGDPIVEFGCGSGRILLPLAHDGFDVTGIDSSQEMLARLEHEAGVSNATGKITSLHGDMSERLPLPADTFGVAIFSLNGLMHLQDQAAQLAALSEAARVLDPRGQLVIDLFNPTPEYLNHLGTGAHLEGSWQLPDGREVEKWSYRTLHPATQTIDTRIWYDTIMEDGAVHRLRAAFTLRYLHAAELALLLDKAGFVEWQFYGTYELDPFDDNSDRLIVLAELTPS